MARRGTPRGVSPDGTGLPETMVARGVGVCSLHEMKKFLGCMMLVCVWAEAAVAAERGTLIQWSTIDALLKDIDAVRPRGTAATES